MQLTAGGQTPYIYCDRRKIAQTLPCRTCSASKSKDLGHSREVLLAEAFMGGWTFKEEVFEHIRFHGRRWETFMKGVVLRCIFVGHAPLCILKAQLFQNVNADAADKIY